jgi:hypothetical protein
MSAFRVPAVVFPAWFPAGIPVGPVAIRFVTSKSTQGFILPIMPERVDARLISNRLFTVVLG